MFATTMDWTDPPTLREAVFALTGALLVLGLVALSNNPGLLAPRIVTKRKKRLDRSNVIRTVEELRAVLPAGGSGCGLSDAKKVIPHLDEQMIGFVARSPFLQLATVGADGKPLVSPKGDGAGFVTVETDAEGRGVELLVPDRPGNRLLFGLQQILENPQVALLFEVPGTGTTLRCSGVASISTDPALLTKMAARGTAPKVVLVVEVTHAFFHCAKAYLRSGLWDPTTWPKELYRVKFEEYWFPSEAAQAKRYKKVRQAIKGERCEEE